MERRSNSVATTTSCQALDQQHLAWPSRHRVQVNKVFCDYEPSLSTAETAELYSVCSHTSATLVHMHAKLNRAATSTALWNPTSSLSIECFTIHNLKARSAARHHPTLASNSQITSHSQITNTVGTHGRRASRPTIRATWSKPSGSQSADDGCVPPPLA
jgi:hypothetical protein